MNIRRFLIGAIAAALSLPVFAAGKTARQLIEEEPGRSGGIYYAYPYTTDEMPPVPEGYEVSFMSHYGRHGSRWIIKTWEYHESIAALDSAARHDGLTPLWPRCAPASQNHGKTGARQ